MDVLAVRVAAQGLARRSGDDPLRLWAIQDSPPGAAVAAVLARAEDASALDDAIALYNPRTATAILPRTEAAAFGTALLPEGDDELKAMLGTAIPGREDGFEEPVELAVAAISDALDGVTLSRDDLHEALRHRLPKELLPWCEGCQSHHARRGLLVMASLRGPAVHRRPRRAPARVRPHRPARGLGSARGRRGATRAALPVGLRPVHAGPLRRVGRDRQVPCASGYGSTIGARRPTRRRPRASGCSRPAIRCCSAAIARRWCRIRRCARRSGRRSAAPASCSWTARSGPVARPQAGQAARGHGRGPGTPPRAALGGRATGPAPGLQRGGGTSLRGVRNKDWARSTSTP